MKNENNSKQAWWMPAIAISVRISVWFIVPILLALFIGKYLNNLYGPSNWIFIGMMILGFFVSMIGITRISINYIKDIEKKSKEDKEKNG